MLEDENIPTWLFVPLQSLCGGILVVPVEFSNPVI
jgi:hypothetical protein